MRSTSVRHGAPLPVPPTWGIYRNRWEQKETIMGHIYAFMSGTRTVNTGEGSDDYTEEHGWVDPDWSRTDLFESRNDVTPLINDDERDEWLPERVRDLIGGPDWHDNGDGTYYGQSGHVSEDDSEWTYAIHFKRKHHDPVRGWVEDAWHPVTDGGIEL